jgi:hypothetical protein
MTTHEKGKPAQTQDTQPGKEHEMRPEPEYIKENYKGSDLLDPSYSIYLL